jgi:hypothetical protein
MWEDMYDEYEICLESDDILDEIPYGKVNYPVAEFFSRGQYDLGVRLLTMGYRCIHVEDPEGFWILCRYLEIYKRERGWYDYNYWRLHISKIFFQEYTALSSADREYLMQAFDISSINKRTLSFFRDNLKPVYSDILSGNIDVCDLVQCCDVKLVEDYINIHSQKADWTEYISQAGLSQNILLEGVLKHINEKCLENYLASLRKLVDYCKSAFSKDYLCDIDTAETIMRLRFITADMGKRPSRREYEAVILSREDVQQLFDEFDQQLQLHMTEEYQLDNVVRALVMSCQVPCDRADMEDSLNRLQPGDYLVLKHLLDYGNAKWEHMEFSISKNILESVVLQWVEKQKSEENDQIFDLFEATRKDVEALVVWINKVKKLHKQQ